VWGVFLGMEMEHGIVGSKVKIKDSYENT